MVSLPGAHAGRVGPIPSGRCHASDTEASRCQRPAQSAAQGGPYVIVERSDYAIRYRSVTFRIPTRRCCCRPRLMSSDVEHAHELALTQAAITAAPAAAGSSITARLANNCLSTSAPCRAAGR
jgi:hypothetical protein